MTTHHCMEMLSTVFRRLRRSRRGNVAIEFGFMVPIFILLTLAAVELGRLGSEWMRLEHAADAGTQYGIYDQGNAGDIPGMISAARSDADDTTNQLGISARRYCRCPESTTDEPCSTTCADGKFSPMYVEVSVSRDLAAMIPLMGLPLSYPIAVTHTSRVR